LIDSIYVHGQENCEQLNVGLYKRWVRTNWVWI